MGVRAFIIDQIIIELRFFFYCFQNVLKIFQCICQKVDLQASVVLSRALEKDYPVNRSNGD